MKDVLRAGSLHKFSRKIFSKQNAKISSDDQLKTVATVTEDCLYGTRVKIHVWKANETDQYDFRLSQVWIASGNTTSNDLNTVEAGWQVSKLDTRIMFSKSSGCKKTSRDQPFLNSPG
ncbi:uncharacterized protein [Coffea arabica]|uniref:Neprosin PEP catalytic domain-containing protein n=1 Tax=Coffea arabica TaxID=13443 RepID=A0ABM4U6C4_COFAR